MSRTEQKQIVRIGGATFQRSARGSLSYDEQDRAAHYDGRIQQDRCPVCLLGMSSTHGRADLVR